MEQIKRPADEILYGVHKSLQVSKPHLGNLLLDAQFILFPKAFFRGVTEWVDNYQLLANKEGKRLAEYMELTRSETIYFSRFFANATAGSSSTDLMEQMATRYAFMGNRLIEVVDRFIANEEEDDQPQDSVSQFLARIENKEVTEDLTTEEEEKLEEKIEKETIRLFEALEGVGYKNKDQWYEILSSAGRTLSTIFLRPHLDMFQAKNSMEYYERQLKILRL